MSLSSLIHEGVIHVLTNMFPFHSNVSILRCINEYICIVLRCINMDSLVITQFTAFMTPVDICIKSLNLYIRVTY